MAHHRHRRSRVIVRERIVQERPPSVASTEARMLHHICVASGIGLVLAFDHAWYWWLATLLISGPEMLPVLVSVVNRCIVWGIVWLGDWVELFFEEAE